MLTTRYAIASVVAFSAYYVMADHGAGGGHVPHHEPHHAPVHHEPAVSYSEPQYYSRKCRSFNIIPEEEFWARNVFPKDHIHDPCPLLRLTV